MACTRQALESGIDLWHFNRGKNRARKITGVNTIYGDILDIKTSEKALKDHHFDVVVNFIAFKPKDIENDFQLFKDKCKQYIFISSASAYQKPPSHPVITEDTPLKNPYWQYSRDKIACEEKLYQLYRENDFPVSIVRPSLTYETVIPVAIGSWADFTLIDRIRRGKEIIVHGDGSSLWTITHSTDFASGFTGLLGHQQAIGHSFHITSDEILTWNQIYEAVAEAAGEEAKIVHIPSDFIARGDEYYTGTLLGDKSWSVIFDNTKIKRFVPEYKAVIPFNKGIKKTIKWFEEKKERMIILEENNRFMDKVIRDYKRITEK